ncbi:MAG: LarC family nickel insertion protein, partial [Methanoregula sp.]
MRILIFDPFHGAAGDMITGALLSLGAEEKTVTAAMGAVVADPGIEIVTRAGVRAVKVHTKATPAHRTLTDVERRLDEAAPDVPQDALAMARRVFARMNAAEESVHGAHVHFHEVGADDAIADVIGACTALAALKADRVAVLPVAVGSGTVTSAHGTMPVPAPATAEILKNSGLAVTAGTGDGELCTPTGAALLAEFSTIAPKDLGAYT